MKQNHLSKRVDQIWNVPLLGPLEGKISKARISSLSGRIKFEISAMGVLALTRFCSFGKQCWSSSSSGSGNTTSGWISVIDLILELKLGFSMLTFFWLFLDELRLSDRSWVAWDLSRGPKFLFSPSFCGWTVLQAEVEGPRQPQSKQKLGNRSYLKDTQRFESSFLLT